MVHADPAAHEPRRLRKLIRQNAITGTSRGLAMGYLQCNLAILLESCSRNFMRMTLPIISMVITFSSLLLKNSAGKWNTLINFGSVSTQLTGQFLVGANSLIPWS
ncbi:MAG: hypothetical protein ACKO3Q_11665 [Betaproteobacteria bacterium]